MAFNYFLVFFIEYVSSNQENVVLIYLKFNFRLSSKREHGLASFLVDAQIKSYLTETEEQRPAFFFTLRIAHLIND